MLGVVLVLEVRVQRVSVVAGDHPRGLDQADIAFLGALADLAIHPLEHVGEERTLGATGAGTTHLFVIIGDQHHALFAVGVEHRLQANKAGQKVVQTGAGDQFLAHAHQRRRLQVIEAQLEVQHLYPGQAVLLFEPGQQQAIEVVVLAPLQHHRRHLGLGIHRLAVVGFAIQVDGQARDDGDGLGDVEQHALDPPIGVTDMQTPGQAQVAVEPGREQCPTVDLHAKLQPARRRLAGVGLQPEIGAVGMGADHAQTGDRLALRQVDGDNRRIVAGHVEAVTGNQIPAIGLQQATVAGVLEPLSHVRGSVPRAGGTVKKLKQPTEPFGASGIILWQALL